MFRSKCARDWFHDNKHLMLTWTIFTQKLIKRFDSSCKVDISFNRLRHYEQDIIQDVRQYYFEIMKLCKESNPFMNDASKLQYLKDVLKPSLCFDVLLKNPQNTEEFLEYAQKIEELKSLNEKQDVSIYSTEEAFTNSPTINSRNVNNKSQQIDQPFLPRKSNDNNVHYKTNYSNNIANQILTDASTTQAQYHNDIPKSPYRCYKCGADDHLIRHCPYFQ
ncbi:unnamed protein product [Rotaria sp. Silwood2]|nr:unnamed protein product [Rotaria sp. Silwood2]CAF2999041.1 unnamed protein product [Rotaria sp. Silwood2]CAF4476555.1 unnamed protein product [Rotaria sp. Silwood2]CAF4519491.1 unnamed protein product [Rotaria sp. Silwood2]